MMFGRMQIGEPDLAASLMDIVNDRLSEMWAQLQEQENAYLQQFWDLTDPDRRHLLCYQRADDLIHQWRSEANGDWTVIVERPMGPVWCVWEPPATEGDS